MKKKEKVNLIDTLEFESVEAAEIFLKKSEKKWKVKLICTVIAAVGTIGILLVFNDAITNDILGGIFAILGLAGIIAAIVAGSFFNYIKVIWKCAKIGYCIVPFYLLDLVGFLIGAGVGMLIVCLLPVVPAGITLLQYKGNIEVAKDFIASNTQPTYVNVSNEEK